MTTNMNTYRGEFINQETTRPDNSPIQQLVTILIYDNETPVTDNPFGIRYRVDRLHAHVSWEALPAGVITSSFGFFNGLWFDASVGSGSAPGSGIISVPAGDWSYRFTLDFGGGDTAIYDLGQGVETELEMADNPLTISTIDNDEDKFTVIKSKQAVIQCYTSAAININRFCQGGDNRYYVSIVCGTTQLLYGFLSLGDLGQTFQPDPNLLVLTATDGLGFLNDEPLVNFDGDNPLGTWPIIDYIAWALYRTGLDLDIDVIMNIRGENATPLISDDSGDGHFYKWTYLKATTFEDEIGTSISSYEVLEQILGEMCFITQHEGRWRIIRRDEMNIERPYTIFRFDNRGVFGGTFSDDTVLDIGVDLPLSWMNDDAEVSPQRPYKLIKETYNYNLPSELVCNQDFSRGTATVEPDLAAPTSTGEYVLECWTMRRLEGQPVTSTAYIKREFEYGYEKERYIVITPSATTATPRDFAQAEGIDVQEKARMTVSVDFRWPTDFSGGGSTYRIARIWIVDNDGNYRYFWHPSSSILSEFYWQAPIATEQERTLPYFFDVGAVDETNWQTLSVDLGVLPADGKLYIGLNTLHQGNAAGDNSDAYFNNLVVNYTPYINGGYGAYTGQYHSVTNSNINIKAKRDREVYISDSPSKLFKGALLRSAGVDYALVSAFYDASIYTNADYPDLTYLRPYGEIQSFDVWNQFNRVMMQFEGSIDGLDSSNIIPDVTHIYRLTDTSESTNNKIFTILHDEQNHDLCEISSVFLQELQDSTIPKEYTGHDFKYITE